MSAEDPAKLYLLAALLVKDGVLSRNGRALFKELILRRDPRLAKLVAGFGSDASDGAFVDAVHALVEGPRRRAARFVSRRRRGRGGRPCCQATAAVARRFATFRRNA